MNEKLMLRLLAVGVVFVQAWKAELRRSCVKLRAEFGDVVGMS